MIRDLGSLGALRALFDIPTNRLIDAARAVLTVHQRSSWELALLLYRLDEEGLATPSLTAWAAQHLGMTSSQVTTYRQAAEALLLAPAEKRTAFIAMGVVKFYESGLSRLMLRAPVRALRIAKAGGTQVQMRATVRGASTKAALPASPPPRPKLGGNGTLVSLVAIQQGLDVVVSLTHEGGPAPRKLSGPVHLIADRLADEIVAFIDRLGLAGAIEERIRRRAA